MAPDEKAQRMSLYFPAHVAAEMRAEALRQDRSVSWLVTRAWNLAKAEIAKAPDAPKAP